MRILLLNLYYPPDTSATAKMAATVIEALSREHEVTVLCGRPSYDPPAHDPWRLWRTEQAGNVRIIRVGSTDYPRNEMRKRLLNYLSYTALAIVRGLFVRCDVVLAMTDPPFEGIVGAMIAMVKGKPYAYNIRDLYPDMAIAGSILKTGMITGVWEVLHRWALRRAALVIVLGEDMRARIIAKGVEPQRVQVVRDGAEIRPLDAPPALDNEVIRAIRGEFHFVLVHAGNLGFYGAWKTLLDAAAALKDEGVGLIFVGEGAQRAALETAAAGIVNVRFLPFFPAEKIPSVMAAADAHVITIKRGLEGVVVPSKMYGIVAAGKPIVVVAGKETDAAALGTKFGFAVSADPEKPGEVAAAVRALIKGTNKVREMGEAARAVADGYDRVKELRKYVYIIEEVCRA